MILAFLILFFFFNATATTEIYTLSLHDALPISEQYHELTSLSVCQVPTTVESTNRRQMYRQDMCRQQAAESFNGSYTDRKSTRLNSSHVEISYAVFCLKKKKKKKNKKNSKTQYK